MGTILKFSYTFQGSSSYVQDVPNENTTCYADTSLSYYVARFPWPRSRAFRFSPACFYVYPRVNSHPPTLVRDRKAARPLVGRGTFRAAGVRQKLKFTPFKCRPVYGTRDTAPCVDANLVKRITVARRARFAVRVASFDLFRLIDTCGELAIPSRWRHFPRVHFVERYKDIEYWNFQCEFYWTSNVRKEVTKRKSKDIENRSFGGTRQILWNDTFDFANSFSFFWNVGILDESFKFV